MLDRLKYWWFNIDLKDMLNEGTIDMEIYLAIADIRNDVKQTLYLASMVLLAFAGIIAWVH